MQLARLISVPSLILLLIGCARSDDRNPGPATDASITAAVKARLLIDSFTPALHIHVATNERVVTLTGKVKSRQEPLGEIAAAFGSDDTLAVPFCLQPPANASTTSLSESPLHGRQ